MGNSNSFIIVHDNYTGRAAFPCHLELGTSAAIKLSREVGQKHSDGGHSDSWTVSYELDNFTCTCCTLSREVCKDGNVNIIRFIHCDRQGLNEGCSIVWPISIVIIKTETNFLELSSFTGPMGPNFKTYKTGDTCTTVYKYTVRGSRGGLVALELKKNNVYEQYNEAIVTHYFADCSKDVGFSVAAKICISNGKLDIYGEGLEQHPPSGLFYMIDEVNRIGKWNPTMCPHCVPKPLVFFSPQNRREISNGGSFVGNQNGNYIENFVVFNRKSGYSDSEDDSSVHILRHCWQNARGISNNRRLGFYDRIMLSKFKNHKQL